MKKPQPSEKQDAQGQQFQQDLYDELNVVAHRKKCLYKIVDGIGDQKDGQEHHDQVDGIGNFAAGIFLAGTVVNDEGHYVENKA